MTIDISFVKSTTKKAEAVVVCFYNDKQRSAEVEAMDYSLGGYLSHAADKSKTFKGKFGQTEILTLPPNAPYIYLIFLGLGDKSKLSPVEIEKLGGKLYAAIETKNIRSAEFLFDNSLDNSALLAAHLAVGFELRSYNFDIYKSEKPIGEQEDKPEKLKVIVSNSTDALSIYKRENAVIKGVFAARDFVNEPPNVLYPYAYANRILELLKPLGVEIEILDDKKLLRHKMGALLAVGQGSANPPCLVIMRWKGLGDDRKSSPLALVGKGVTFDTGGISLKPGAGMDEMKMDMAGSAAVVGTMMALALRKAKANVVGIVGIVENMPSDRAYRPADIVTSYSGKTIEVLNTDAEGRLVLADALGYVQKIYKPSAIIDLATLTGAMIVALGHEYCGTFVNSDMLWDNLRNASVSTGEKLWRMPLDDFFKKDMESQIADLQNVAKSGRDGGSCTAAGFLWHFIENDIPWAHLDIAGTAWIKSDRDITPKFGTGFGVRLLDRLVEDYYE